MNARTLPLLENVDNDPRGTGRMESAWGQLPLIGMDLRASVSGLIAECVVTQTFVNTYDEPIECTYIFPLPDRAAVTKFEMRVADGVVRGMLKERGHARREYQRAIAEEKRAAITEEERAGVFSLRAGNLQPGEEAVVELVMVSLLVVNDAEATFRFPLVVAPRYTPGTPLDGPHVGLGVVPDTDRVRDASRVAPPLLATATATTTTTTTTNAPTTAEPSSAGPKLTIRCDLATLGLPIDDVRSSLHTIVIETNAEGTVRRLAVDDAATMNRDFVLRFRVGADKMTSSLRVIPDPVGDDATIVLALTPPLHVSTPRRPLDVVFLVDKSGSMRGWKMSAAKQAVASLVETLSHGDRFRVYAFNESLFTHGDAFQAEIFNVDARSKEQALAFIAAIYAGGGTEMQKPLEVGLDLLAGGYSDRERVVVLITDGQVTNEAELVRTLEGRMKGTTIFAVGIDDAVNGGLLTRLAVASGGSCELVESEARLDNVLGRLHCRLRSPALSEISIAIDGFALDEHSMTPARLAPLVPGLPMLVLARGRITSTPRANVVPEVRALVTGVGADGRTECFDVRGIVETLPGMRHAWARSVVRDLEDRFDRGDEDVRPRLTRLSLDENVLCRFTAFVAVDERTLPKIDKSLSQVVQAVLPPESLSAPPPSSVGRGPARLGELLVRDNLLSLQQPKAAKDGQKQQGGTLGSDLTRFGSSDDEQRTGFLSKQYGVPAINLHELEIDSDIIKLIPKEVAEKHRVVPVNRTGGSLLVAMSNPSNIFAIDDIKFLTGSNIEVVVASDQEISSALQTYYTGNSKAVVDLESFGQESPVTTELVRLIIVDAITRGATMIVIQKTPRESTVSYRIDGLLQDVMKPPLKLWDEITARICAMAQMESSATSGTIEVLTRGGMRARLDVVILSDGAIVLSVRPTS
jgi:Ca-activated chloride channel family protein